ncbi:HPP family protein [Alicyclobacillus fastidiosus]|uniref:HPP family protein n=1 Tax=Alicyclobacillus fastidiosus TaxID=392011 RepID=UPI0034DD6248
MSRARSLRHFPHDSTELSNFRWFGPQGCRGHSHLRCIRACESSVVVSVRATTPDGHHAFVADMVEAILDHRDPMVPGERRAKPSLLCARSTSRFSRFWCKNSRNHNIQWCILTDSTLHVAYSNIFAPQPLVPPFSATLTILLLLPKSPIAQPIPVVVGTTISASAGTAVSLLVHGPIYGVLVTLAMVILLPLLRIYHPPGVALSMYPLLLHTDISFPVLVVLPFTLIAVSSCSVLSKLSKSWADYPLPLKKAATLSESASFDSSLNT